MLKDQKQTNLFSFFLALFLIVGVTGKANAAFTGVLNGTTLTLTQVADNGNVVIDNNGAGTAFRSNDGAGTVTFSAAANVIVNLLNNTNNQLNIDLDNTSTGDLILNLGDGARAVNFTGTSNVFLGSLTINGGTDGQTIELAVNSAINIGGDLIASLGTGADSIDEDNKNITIGNDLRFTGVNFFENGGVMIVGGNAIVDSTVELDQTLFDDDNSMTITGNFIYRGGDGRDEITLNGVGAGAKVFGNAQIDVGDNTQSGVTFIFFNLPNAFVGGDLTVKSSGSINQDRFSMHPAATFGGNVSIDLGDGSNDASFSGTMLGTAGSYTGGSGIDNVTVNVNAPNTDFEFLLKDGNDLLFLNNTTTLKSLFIDFGCLFNDTFTDGFAGPPYPFPTKIWNLAPGQCRMGLLPGVIDLLLLD